MEKYRIGKVYISRITPEKAILAITKAVKEGRSEYICVSNVRTVSYANKHEDYCNLMNNAYMCTPDGMPLVWMARLWGLKDVQRTVGPDLFTTMMNDKDSGIKHFLLGDTEETLARMKEKYADNGANIAGSYSPPFCELDEFDYEGITATASALWRIIGRSSTSQVWSWPPTECVSPSRPQILANMVQTRHSISVWMI